MDDIAKIQRAIANATAKGDTAAAARMQSYLDDIQAAPVARPEVGMRAGDVASSAIKNFGPSLYNYGADMVRAVTDLPGTLSTMGDLGAGVLREGARAALPESVFNAIDSVGNQEAANRASATASVIGGHYKGRYGSVEGFKKAIAEDPVGVMSDLSLPVTGVGGLAARAGGSTGRLGRLAQITGTAMDPVSAVVATGRGGVRAASHLGGWATGMGDEPIQAIFDARRAGGEQAAAANRGMRESPRGQELVEEAGSRMDILRDEAGARYEQGLQPTLNSRARVNWGNVFRSIHDTLRSNMTRQGYRFTGGASGRQMMQEILDTVHQYVSDPALHNLEGLDGLKRELALLQHPIGAQPVRGAENANRLVTNVINGVRDEIIRLEPTYGQAMLDHKEFTNLRDELRQSLSLHDKASTDTTLRKLQSTMRNNASTNYGARLTLLDELDSVAAPAIPARPGRHGRPALHPGTMRAELAGQAANTWRPRGIAAAGGAAAIPGAIAWALQNPWMLGGMAVSAPFAMPRAVGEVAGSAGSVAGLLDRTAAANPGAAATARRVTGNPGRQVARQIGVATREVEETPAKEGVFQDAQGRWFDINGKPVQ